MKFSSKRDRKRYFIVLSAVLVALLVAACSPVSREPSSMDVVQASYLDLSGNISDLRSRVTQWQNGDEDSRKIAEEKIERIEIILNAIGWPDDMAEPIGKVTAAIKPMQKALKDQDLAAAETAAKTLGDASHDVTHAYYGDWLLVAEDIHFAPMGLHAAYLDLNANIADLQSRIDQWQKGDESSLNIAKEKAERIGVLIPHFSSYGVLARHVQSIERGLSNVDVAIERKDAGAAQRAVKPITDASRDLARDFYIWMNLSAGAEDAGCVQASYLDLSRNIADLRASVAQWQKGDEKALSTAKEKLARVEIVLTHPVWPDAMSDAVAATRRGLDAMAKALEDKDLASAEAAAKALGDGSHEVTHAFYADWLPTSQMASVQRQIGTTQAKSVAKGHSDGHGSAKSASAKPDASTVAAKTSTKSTPAKSGGHVDAARGSGPNWFIVGGFLASLVLITGIAAITKHSAVRAAGSNQTLGAI